LLEGGRKVILRLWRGWTAPAQTDAYEQLLTGQIAPAILDREIPGLRELRVLRRDSREVDPAIETEFLTVMTFDDLAAITAFTGGDPSGSVVPDAARQLLSRFDDHSQHYTSRAVYTAHPQ
jgi:hypothetical protein